MAKRRSRKRRRGLGTRLILIIALVLLIAGFIARRMLITTGYRGFQRSDPQRFGAADSPWSANGRGGTPPHARGAGENLNDVDRAELDAIIRSKTR